MTPLLTRRRYGAAMVLLVCAFATDIGAQTPQQLSLQQAIGTALRRHPTLDLAEATVERAQTLARDAKAARMPSLSLDGSAIRFQEPMVVAPLHGLDLRNPPIFDRTLAQGSLTLGYTLFDAARGGRIERAEALVGAAEGGAEAARLQLIADVARDYLRAQSAREVAVAQARRRDALAQEQARAAQLVAQGRAARVVLLRADAALSMARAEAVSAGTDVEVAENELARQLAVAADSLRQVHLPPIRAADNAPATPAAVHAAARAANPDILRAQRQVAAAQALRGEARALWLPKVQLNGRFIEYASPSSHPQGEWQAGAQLSYPLFTGGARSAANERAGSELRAATAEYELTARRIDEAIDRAFSTLAAARARVVALEAAVAQSEEVTRIDRLALDAGAGVQSDYLAAEADLFRARAALTDARALELLARIELARLSGELSESWIAQNVEPLR